MASGVPQVVWYSQCMDTSRPLLDDTYVYSCHAARDHGNTWPPEQLGMYAQASAILTEEL